MSTQFKEDLRVRRIADHQHVQVSELCWAALSPRLGAVSILRSAPACADPPDFRFRPSRLIDNLPVLLRHGSVTEVSVAAHGIPRRDLDVIYRAPMIIIPTSWNKMERGFIVKCWERLRTAASEKLGHDPGRDLEMQAVFRKVDFSYVRRSRYDARTKKLHLFVGSPSGTVKSELGRCAIIIGLVKSSGEILQVAMPLVA